ncbi:sigma-70 family RNA polymerase sigma factor [Alistipes sp. OttesenSCG-928-B03]|nr:sigma-70 family RNA polymerase sigma factor [Alistipes sp. OttesenSCG-928-B03]
MDDNALLKRITDSDRSAFDILAGRYVIPLNVLAYRIIGDRDVAKDIVQDAFVHIWENRKKLNDVTHMRNYLSLIVRNYSINCAKRLSRSSRLGSNMDLREEDFSIQYIRVETARLIYEAVESLPSPTAEVMRLSLEGLKQEEIARQLNIALPTVKVHKSKGLRKLKEILEPLSYLILILQL